LCLTAGCCQASCPALETQLGSTTASASQHHTTHSPWLNNCLCVIKHGLDTYAWLQVAAKQAALAALETQLGSTNSSASQNRDQIQRLQLQMTELQDQHVAWQQSMLDGRLQELRAAAARVENNQALKARSLHLLTLPEQPFIHLFSR